MPEVSGSRRSSVQLHRKRHSLPHAAAQGAPGDILADTQATLGLEIATPISLHASRVSLDNAGGTNLRRTAAHSDFAEALAVAKCELDGVEEEGRPQAASPEGRGSGTRGGAAAARFRAWMRRVADYFDLYLLCDFRFLMVFIGLTLAYVGEINFSLFASFVFLDKGFGLEKAATMMSTLASVDLVTRFTMPIFSDHFKLDSIFMYSIGLTLLATGRIMLAHLSSYTGILCATLWLGLGKGFRTVYMALVIPSIVPLEKLPSASGLQTLASGILFFTIGPLFGYIRDNSDSYLPALYTINVFTFGAILVWILEAVCTRSRKRREAEKKKKKNKTNCVNTIVIVK